MPEDVTRSLAPEVDQVTSTFGIDSATASYPQHGATSLDSSFPVIPGYELLEVIGRGGMGLVFRATQRATNRTVAIKLLLAGDLASDSARERFKAEAESTAKLSHPNIVQLYEAGDAGGRAFFSCEFMAGGSLAGRLDGTPWEGKRSARMLVPLAQAVAAAHVAGIIHRDLKPANVLLAADGSPKIADFGIAKQMDSDSNTHTGAILGTPSYMPPEQAGGAKAVGAGADVYSLGAMLYELLTGRPPFKGADFVETIDQVRRQEPVAPSILQPKLPRDIETICLKCLQKAPEKRYESATALAEDLQRFLDGRPIAARPVGNIERVWRWAKRSPAVAALLALTLVLFSVGTAVSVFFAVRADAAKEMAEQREREANDERGKALKREQEANAARLEVQEEQSRGEHQLYISLMNHAQTAVNEHRTARLRELLEETKPKPGKTDHRNWEWHYLNRLANSWDREVKPNAAAIPGYRNQSRVQVGGVQSVPPFITRDGTRLVVPPTATSTPSGTHVIHSLPGAVFSTTDGAVIIPEVKVPLNESYFGVSFSPDGLFMVSQGPFAALEKLPPGFVGPPQRSVRFRAYVREVATGRNLLPEIDFPYPDQILVSEGAARVTFLPTPGLHTLPGEMTRAKLLVWERGKTGTRTYEIMTEAPNGGLRHAHPYSISPDGAVAIVLKDSKSIVPDLTRPQGSPSSDVLEIWDVSGEPILRKAHRNPAGHLAASFSSGGAVLAATDSKEVGVFDVKSGERVGLWTLPRVDPSKGFIGAPIVSDDGRTIVVASSSGTVYVGQRLYASETSGKSPEAGLRGAWRTSQIRLPSAMISSLGDFRFWLAPDGSRLLAIRDDNTIHQWNIGGAPGYAVTWPYRLSRDGAGCQAVPSRRAERILYIPDLYITEPRKKTWAVGVYTPANLELRWLTIETSFIGVGSHDISPDGTRLQLPLTKESSRGVEAEREERWTLRKLTPRGKDELDSVELAKDFMSGLAYLSASSRWLVETQLEPANSKSVFSQQQAGFKIRSAETGKIVVAFPSEASASALACTSEQISPDDRMVTAITYPMLRDSDPKRDSVPIALRSFDLIARKPSWTWTMPIAAPVIAPREMSISVELPLFAYSGDGKEIAVAAFEAGGSLHVWILDSGNGTLIRELTASSAARGSTKVSSIAFGPGGRMMVGYGRDAVVWDGGAPIRLTGHESRVHAGLFSADGRRLFTLDVAGEFEPKHRVIRVWDLPTGKELLAIREPEREVIDQGRGAMRSWQHEMWLEGEKLMLMAPDGILVFEGTPR